MYLYWYMQITEDMTRLGRTKWGLLNKFLTRVRQRYPGTQAAVAGAKLYLDGRTLSVRGATLEEESVFAVPLAGMEYEKQIRAELRSAGRCSPPHFFIIVHIAQYTCETLWIRCQHVHKLQVEVKTTIG